MTFGEWLSVGIWTNQSANNQENDSEVRYRYAIAGQRVLTKAWGFRPDKRRLSALGTVTMGTGGSAGIGSMPADYGGPGPHMRVYVDDAERELTYMEEGELFHLLEMNPGDTGSQPLYYTFSGQTVLGRRQIYIYPPNDAAMTLNIRNYTERRPIGVDRPGAPTIASVASAGTLTGTYTWKTTHVTADGETEGGEISASSGAIVSKQAALVVPVSRVTGVTSRKVYRIATGGVQYKLVGTISDNLTTAFTDNIADGSLGANIPTATTAVTGLEMFPEQHHEGALLDALLSITARNRGDGRTGEFSQVALSALSQMWMEDKEFHVPMRMPRYGIRR
jgi:hypothetical protein